MGNAGELEASSLSDLARVEAYVARACERAGADPDSRFALRLAVEESFTNIMQHGYGPGGGPVKVGVRCAGSTITVVMRDRAPPFDPTGVPAPDLRADWQERAVGGFGLHLVRNMVDKVGYERSAGGENVLTLAKGFARVVAGS